VSSEARRTPNQGGGISVATTHGPTASSPAQPSATAPSPAHVTLQSGTLTVEANNSDLSSILKDIAAASGMAIEGLDKSARVFGQYGPGTPRDVLTELLDGTGYNFVLLGGANGSVPRELVLTARSNTPLPAAAAAANSEDEDNSDEDDQESPGPGALVHVPPEVSDDPQERAQQHLENLERMREILDQREQQQQDNPPQ
jgi:hypothetical protein